jgi:iron complex outermembrane recepter protein
MKPITFSALGIGFFLYASVSSAQQSASTPDKVDGQKASEIKASIPEILVEGSRILNADIVRTEDDIQPYQVFDSKEIRDSGARNIEEFFSKRLTAATNPKLATQSAEPTGAASSVNLRGFGTDQTLVLIDGRRVSGFTISGMPRQPDLNGIPLAAVERIEVLATTASGIYGGSAIGGVINIVMRRDYSGVETDVVYGDSFAGGAATKQVNLSAGLNLEGGKTNVLMSGSYREDEALLAHDRDFTQRLRAHINANDPTFYPSSFPPIGQTTNIMSLGGDLTLKNGTALNSMVAHVPNGYAGVSGDGGAALAATAGQYNLALANTAQGGGGRFPILSANSVKSGNVSVRREFTSWLQGFVEFGAAENSSNGFLNGANDAFFIPATAPNNPFDQDVYVTTPVFGMDSRYEVENSSRRATAGFIAKLPNKWQLVADYSWSRTRASALFGGVVNADGNAAVADGIVDVFRDTNVYPLDFSSYKSDPFAMTPTRSTLKDTNLRLAGPVATWPAGDVTASVLLEHRNESFGSGYSLNAFQRLLTSEGSQTVDSLYLETTLPLVSARNHFPGAQLMELQLAARRDEYTIRGANVVEVDERLQPLTELSQFTNEVSSTNPTVGFRYQPIVDLMLRGSYGRGFRPPTVDQMGPGPDFTLPASTAAILGLSDPRRGNEPLGDFLFSSGGNPNLEPERSKSWSAGFVISPRTIPNFRLSLDWTKTEKTGQIAALSLSQETIDQELSIPGLVSRALTTDGSIGAITGVNLGLLNIARAEFEAYDASVDYGLEVPHRGAFDLSLGVTRLMHFKTQTTEASPVVENVGVETAAISGATVGGGLRWKANSTLVWSYNDWKLGWAAQYYGSYWLNLDHSIVATQGSRTIPSQIYHDAFLGWMVPIGSRFSAISKLEIQLNVQNVFDKSPPVDVIGAQQVGYSPWGDPRLANYSISFRTGF